MRSLRPAGEHGRSVPSGLAQRGTLMVDYSARLLKVVSRRGMCLTASDVSELKALDAVLKNPVPIILRTHDQQAGDYSQPRDCPDCWTATAASAAFPFSQFLKKPAI